MKDLIIKNGLVYDPLNNIDGEKKEIHIKDGVIVDKVNSDAKISNKINFITPYLYQRFFLVLPQKYFL